MNKMKTTEFRNITIALLLICSLFATTVRAQKDITGDEILSSLKKGDAKSLGTWFNSSLDLEMPGNEGTYSKAQAEVIIDRFFRDNPSEGAEYIHSGSSDNGSKYYIGIYKCEDIQFRFYLLLKKVSGKMLIHQVQFEED